MKTPHPIPYQGSKRLLAPLILNYFPRDAPTLIEPFAGAAAVSLAAARTPGIHRIVLNDINKPLMELWRGIIEEPEAVVSAYEKLWRAQLGKEREYYDVVRQQFNKTQNASSLLYLLARCVKASVRDNSDGHFNQSPDNRRRGMNPKTMRWHILAASRLLREKKTKVTSGDYWESLQTVRRQDLVYMDPPYQGVCANRDPRYLSGPDFDKFMERLHQLNERGISFILSYDGRTGNKSYGRPMPEGLGLVRIEIDAGRSSQATLLGRDSNTFESVYLSPSLVERLGTVSKSHLAIAPKQLHLLA